MEERLYNRELSWLSFNHRVLQEAQNPEVPLYERLKFLAIYSSNLDEFFRVRVAALRSFRALGKSTRKELDEAKIKKTLRTIRQIVEGQQELFGRIFRETLLPELQTHGIFLLNAQSISPGQQLFVEQYFQKEVQAHIQIHWVDAETGELPFLQNRALYFVVQSTDSKHFALVNIPSPPLPRFIELPSPEGRHDILFLDDAIRFNLPNLLGMEIAGAYAVKLSRNADLPIDDEYSGDLLEKIKKGLEKRHVGPPTRLLYDKSMPEPLLERLKTLLDLNKNDLIPGARYHNFNDFFDFPNPSSDASLVYPPMPPLPHPVLEQAKSLLDCMKAGDQMLHYPYHKFDYVIRLIREAADDPQVSFLKITVYRAASRSAVVDALQYALSKGKKVTVFIEAKARFDEEANLQWGEQLAASGADVHYSYPGIKVHAKILLLGRQEDGGIRHYAYLSTGNFNEKTSRIYADHALLSADPRLADEAARVFDLLERKIIVPDCKNLLVAPFTLKDKLKDLIDKEIANAKAGQPAYILLKLNSLEEPAMVEKLYEAGQAGVRIKLIIRGICCLKPGVPGLSDNIEAISIVDRFLEHARIYLFANGGDERLYIASADWMKRNLHRRIEVAIPIYDTEVFRQIKHIFDLQWQDNCRARVLNAEQDNPMVAPATGAARVRSQEEIYGVLKGLVLSQFSDWV
jgi:polyphosphate kinase